MFCDWMCVYCVNSKFKLIGLSVTFTGQAPRTTFMLSALAGWALIAGGQMTSQRLLLTMKASMTTGVTRVDIVDTVGGSLLRSVGLLACTIGK